MEGSSATFRRSVAARGQGVRGWICDGPPQGRYRLLLDLPPRRAAVPSHKEPGVLPHTSSMVHDHQNVHGRAVVAVALMVLFYVLALLTVAALGFGVVRSAQAVNAAGTESSPVLAVFLMLSCCGAALVLLRSVAPRGVPFTPPGPALVRATHPLLFQEVEHIARDTGQRMPDRIYLLNDVNAFVAETGGFFGLGTQRVLALGLPLLCALDMQQLRAVIGHEFGHLADGDVKLLPCVYRARLAMISVANLGGPFRLIAVPFRWYALAFLRFTQALSREQELAADVVGARLAGALHSVSALRTAEACGAAFNAYFHSELKPLLELGRLPPVAEGFKRYLHAEYGRAVIHSVERQPSQTTDPYDAHPPLTERVAALHRLSVPRAGRDDRPAINLLNEVPGYELALVRQMLGNRAAQLEPVEWKEAGSVFAARWLEQAATIAKALGARHFEDLVLDPAAQRAFIARYSGQAHESATAQDMERWTRGLVLQLVFAGLCMRGFRVESLPGEPVRFYDGKVRHEPASIVGRLVEGRFTREQWREWCQETGLSKVDLEHLAGLREYEEEQEAVA
jgi:heat shock protein HtpX